MASLNQISIKYNTDKNYNYHDYIPFYEKYFENFRESSNHVLEIGLFQGASNGMWKEYFKNAIIYGLDIYDYSYLDSERVVTFIGDQANRKDLERIFSNMVGKFDIIIDDGGHYMDQQQISLGYLFKMLRSGGLFVIEDLHTSYMDEYIKNGDTLTLDILKSFISNRKIESIFINEEEKKYLEENIEEVIIEKGNHSEIAFIRKK